MVRSNIFRLAGDTIMNIQWFPGHMTKAIRMMEENLRLVDALIYVIE